MILARNTGICLNMIVKNETPVLNRLFLSLKNVIDYYVIVDTGSTDGTPDLIRERMADYGIPGEVHHREWVNFSVNRNQALQLACAAGKSRWALIIDADEELGCSDSAFVKRLQPGVTYELEKHHGKMRYALPNLIDLTRTQWQWHGAVHEYLMEKGGASPRQRLTEAWIIYHKGEGARSRGVSDREKFLRDARLLEKELETNPADCRSRFYLAQSYRDAGELQAAYDNYRLRAEMTGGWDQETFMARLEAGRMARRLGMAHPAVLEELLAAYDLRPARAEPLHELAAHCRLQGRYGQAYLFAKMGSLIPCPDDTLFVHHDVYRWRMLDELSVAAYWTGKYQEARELCERLIAMAAEGGDIDATDMERIVQNLAFARQKC
ncbi:MAG TPA: glycosyltransferase [Geomonas sp.]|nr:glycosyltransferase [Geomonas sp.]